MSWSSYRSEASKAHKRMIDSPKWRKYSRRYLKRHPYCESPHCEGKYIPSKHVDHKTRPEGDSRLFWKNSNHWALCFACHNGPKQSQERGGHGFLKGSDVNGEPLTPDHPWWK